MDIQRDEAFEEAFSAICKPVIARPYPRNVKGEYIYKEIHEAYVMWQEAKAQAVPEGFVLVPKESLKVALFWMNEDIDPWQMGGDSFADLFEHKPILEKVLIEAQEKNMNNQVCIGRHINNISINPLEYLLDDNGEIKLFADEVTAKAHLAELGYSDEDAYWMVIKAQEHSHE